VGQSIQIVEFADDCWDGDERCQACATIAARNGCADWMTCENRTGHRPCRMEVSFIAIGSLAATRSRSSAGIRFSTAEFTPHLARVVATSECLRVFASSSAWSSEERRIEIDRVVLNALGNGPKGAEFTVSGRLRRQPRGVAEPARRKFPA